MGKLLCVWGGCDGARARRVFALLYRSSVVALRPCALVGRPGCPSAFAAFAAYVRIWQIGALPGYRGRRIFNLHEELQLGNLAIGSGCCASFRRQRQATLNWKERDLTCSAPIAELRLKTVTRSAHRAARL